MKLASFAVVMALFASAGWAQQAAPPGGGAEQAGWLRNRQFWVFTFANFLRDDALANKIALMRRAAGT